VIAALLHVPSRIPRFPRPHRRGVRRGGGRHRDGGHRRQELPQAERKRIQVETAAHKSRKAKILKLADKTSNIRAIAASPPADWSVKRRIEYVDWAEAVGRELRGVCPWLEAQLGEAVARRGGRLRRMGPGG